MSRGFDDELLALYALDALDDDERRQVDDAVAASPELARRLAEHQRAAAALGASVAAEPPPDLKARVLAAAFAELPPRAATSSEAPDVVVPFARPRSRRRTPLVAMALGLAAAAALALAVVRLGDGSGAATYELAGSGQGRIEATVDDGVVELVGRELPDPGAGKTFQLWIVGPDQVAEPAGLFGPDADGEVRARFEVDLDEAMALAVTVEPAAGSPQPTSPVAYVATIDA